MGTTIELSTIDGPMPAYVAEPAGEARSGVVVIQEAFGLTGHIQRVADALAEAGHLAVAPALFHRTGAGVFDYGDLSAIGPSIMALTGKGVAADVDAAVAELARRGVPLERTGIVGFCMGGTVALATAARLPLGGAVTYYGGGIAEGRFGLPSGLDAARALKAPWLGLYGDLDAHIPVDEVEQLRAVVAEADLPAEVVRYAEADHGFHCDDRASFHAATSADAWQRTLAFFGEHLA